MTNDSAPARCSCSVGKVFPKLWLLRVGIVKSIGDSVIRASDTEAPLSDRHEAFGELVVRFQDMAFAYAFAVLGDAYLAEDVAQEAFITAWHRLSQLREPDAFPGWFKRVVSTQCNRLLRTKKLQFVGADSAAEIETSDPGPHLAAERRQLVRKVLNAISELPEKQRIVTLLFYMNEFSQNEIGRFLALPISTVNKRLYTAREKLKETIVEVVKTDLQQHRPSRDNTFSNEVNARLRPLSKNDWSSITRMAFGGSPRDVLGKELWLSRRQNFAASKYVRRQYVAEERKRILGYGAIEQSIYLPRYKLFIVASPRSLQRGVGDLLLNQLLKDLEDATAVTVSCHERSSNTELINLLTKRGFEEVTRQLDSRLTLADASTNSVATSQQAMERIGVTISTLAEERAREPNCVEKLYQLNVLLEEEKNDSGVKPPAFDAREALMWLQMPYVLPDGYFVARHGDRYVGVIDVNLRDCLPRGVTLSGPGVLPEYRRQGIATALMSHAIAYSKTAGYSVIRAFNGLSDKLLLQLIRQRGFKTELETVTLEKCLRTIISIHNPQLYDEYTGTYVAKRPNSQMNLEVRKESSRLTLEFNGQKVELYPTSETDFFIKYFYGEVSFVRSPEGRVGYLDCVLKNGNSAEKYRAIKLAKVLQNRER